MRERARINDSRGAISDFQTAGSQTRVRRASASLDASHARVVREFSAQVIILLESWSKEHI
jgi:hypothetical protein